MVADATTGEFVSARTKPQLVLVEPTVTPSALTVSAPGMEPLEIAFSSLDNKPFVVAR